jgi:nucleoside-diphosphate-sugar epimerase
MTSPLAGRRILVTGAAGRIGSVVAAELTTQGALVTALTDVADEALAADRVIIGDTRSEDDVAAALADVELVVHLAALPHRDAGTPYEVYTTNVVSTFNVLAQAGARGIRRAVIASSINAYGVPLNPHDVLPAYFPLDESIPSDVGDWYSLSKQNDENTASMASRHWGIDVVSFRFPLVGNSETLRQESDRFRAEPANGVRVGWAYLDTRDAALAVSLGLTAPLSGPQTFFVAADTTSAPYATEDLLTAFAPGVPRSRRFVGREVPIDLTAVRTVLGFRARHELDVPTLALEA